MGRRRPLLDLASLPPLTLLLVGIGVGLASTIGAGLMVWLLRANSALVVWLGLIAAALGQPGVKPGALEPFMGTSPWRSPALRTDGSDGPRRVRTVLYDDLPDDYAEAVLT